MANNKKQTSKTMAKLASETLKNPRAPKIQKRMAGSVLSQSNSYKQTGKMMEGIASKVLNSSNYSRKTRRLAGSILSQSNKKR